MGESAAQLAQTPQHLRDPRTKTSSSGGVETAQAVYVAEGGAKEVTHAPWKHPEDREWIPEMGH